MDSQDWESATRHCSRAMALPLDVINGEFARATVVRARLSNKFCNKLSTGKLAHCGESHSTCRSLTGRP